MTDEAGRAPGSGPGELATHVGRTRERFELGTIEAEDAAAALGRVHLVDTAGHAWTVGVRSNDWYRFRDGRWLAAGRPPDPAALLSSADLLAACPSCGAPSSGTPFCGECGTARPASRLSPEAESALADFLEHGYDTLPEPLPERPAPAADGAGVPDPRRAPRGSSAADAPAPLVVTTTPTPAPAPTPTPARRPRRIRAALSGLSTVLGLGLLVLSGSRLVLGLGSLGDEPVASPIPGASTAPVSSPTPAGSLAVLDPSAQPTTEATAQPSGQPVTTGTTWFADSFDTEGAWPTGDDGLSAGRYSDGRYLLRSHATDLPVYRWAVNEGSVGDALSVETVIEFRADDPVAVGLVVGDADDLNRLLVLIEPGGEWALARDDVESFETLATGRAEALGVGTPHRLGLRLDGSGSVSAWLDGVELTSAPADLVVARVGLALWSVADGGRVAVDDYLVTVP
jgi:hypothetical protein